MYKVIASRFDDRNGFLQLGLEYRIDKNGWEASNGISIDNSLWISGELVELQESSLFSFPFQFRFQYR